MKSDANLYPEVGVERVCNLSQLMAWGLNAHDAGAPFDALFAGYAYESSLFERCYAFNEAVRQLELVFPDDVDALLVDPLDSRSKADDTRQIGSAGFEC